MTPTPTSTPGGITVAVTLNQPEFHSGDTLELYLALSNQSAESPTVDAWLVLEVPAGYYFMGLDTGAAPPALYLTAEALPLATFPFPAGMEIPATKIWELTFPELELPEPLACSFYFALLSAGTPELLSNLSEYPFTIAE